MPGSDVGPLATRLPIEGSRGGKTDVQAVSGAGAFKCGVVSLVCRRCKDGCKGNAVTAAARSTVVVSPRGQTKLHLQPGSMANARFARSKDECRKMDEEPSRRTPMATRALATF